MTKSWRDVLPIHPAAELFPLLPADELRALGEDIIKHGMTSPVALWHWQKEHQLVLLDGRNRLDALEACGRVLVDEHGKLIWSEWLRWDELRGQNGTDPYEYVASANIHRRHLTAEQKRELIAKLIQATPEK